MKAGGILLAIVCAAALFMQGCASTGKTPPDSTTAGSETAEASPEESVPPSNPEAPPADAEFVVSEDLYRKTFGEIEQLINTLNQSIRDKDYEQWVNYLSPEYADRAGNPKFLADASQSAVLKKNGITLRSLKDYFLYVVVPSRSQAKLDDISFVDERHVKAITVMNEKPVILYWLVKSDARWKMGIW